MNRRTPHHYYLREFEESVGERAKPCPFCRSTNLMMYIGRKANVNCFGCGAEGPESDTREDNPSRALRLWNIRGEQNGSLQSID